jgi:hypothetical protein
MPNTFTSNVFSSTYKDDFLDSDNYHRILFNSGRALQARELTQMQTIIQEEIARFGRNIFKEGSAVNPGGPSINNEYEFVKLAANALSGITSSSLVGLEFTQANGAKARVLEVVEATGSDPDTLYIQYTYTKDGAVGTTPVRFGENVSITSGDITLTTAKIAQQPVTGRGCKINNAAGDFFVRGHFVFVKPQGLILSKYSNNPSKVIGFKVTEDIVTSTDNNALFDNQGATPNTTSPGADRYRIQLVLTTEDLVASSENFVYYCDVFEGKIVDQVDGKDDYNKINDLLAERTKEESGNYIAKRFKSTVSDAGVNVNVNVSPGIAYVNGYRASTEKPTDLTIAKSQTTIVKDNDIAPVSYGSFFVCDTFEGKFGIDSFEVINLRDKAGYTDGTTLTLGTARVRYVEKEGSNFNVYLFDIKMTSGKSIGDVKSIGLSTIRFANVVLENTKAVLKEPANQTLVYSTSHPRIKTIASPSFEVQRVIAATTGTNGDFTISGLNSDKGETFVNSDQWIVTDDLTGDVASSTFTITSPFTSATINTSLASGRAVTVLAKVNKATPIVRPKQLNEKTLLVDLAQGLLTDSRTGVKYVDLHNVDIVSVSEIKQTNTNGVDLSYLFTVDNGQRASHYANGRLVLDAGASDPTGTLHVKYKHFEHQAGDFFSPDSYTGEITYEKIPNLKENSRSTINLRDVIDFRSSVDSAGAFSNGGRDAVINELPKSGNFFSGDVTNYLKRSDKIVVTEDGIIKNITGTPALSPSVPPTPENTLPLFEIEHNAYGLNEKDLVIRPVEAKRFTMKDISKLEKRIDKLEEVTSLSLLEVDTSSLLVLDGSGAVRTKSGFFVDNFRNRAFTDTQNIENRAAIDPSLGTLQPQQVTDNYTLRYDSDKSNNTVLKGDIVYINYSHDSAIKQTKVTGTENVNPFAVITGTGSITMSPASDEWQDITFNPANIIEQTDAVGFAGASFDWSTNNFVPMAGWGEITQNFFNGWNGDQMWNWNGVTSRPPQQIPTGTPASNQVRRGVDEFTGRIVVGNRTIREVVDEREVSLTFLPFIRPRKVFFKAEGLRPNTRFYPFFDGVAVDNFVKSETFQNFSDSTAGGVEYGDEFRNSTEHPQTKSNLESDANGTVQGSFFIPCNAIPEDEDATDTGVRFRTGEREFKLLDISSNDNDVATSTASFIYVASGTLSTRVQTMVATRPPRPIRTQIDPLAQSFRVTKENGMFVTKVDCYFKTKDASVPIQLQIRPMVNGVPSSSEILGNAIKFVNAGSVVLPSEQTATAVLAAPTTFEFDEPIFLNPNTEYAIVLLADSTNYEAYVAETYAFELGSTEAKISSQPSMGSLFKSQNGSTWSPDQTKDLMFKMHNAVFDTAGGTAVFENTDTPNMLLSSNPLYSVSGDATISVLAPKHGYRLGDVVTIAGLTGSDNNGITAANINGDRTITAADGFGFQFEAGSNADTTGRFGGASVKFPKQTQVDGVVPNFSSLIPDSTTISFTSQFTNGKSLAGSETPYGKAQVTGISIGEENFFTVPKIIANRVNELASIGAAGSLVRSTTFNMSLSTSSADVSPILDTQRTSITTISNLIDKQASSVTAGFNVPINYVAETNGFGGSALAKHHTAVSSLEEPAVGLKVILAALRPSESDFELYFRTSNDGDDILDKDWTLATKEIDVAPDTSNFREYRYLIGGVGGTLDDFTSYQYKIVFLGTNSSSVPIIKDFRSIALAV